MASKWDGVTLGEWVYRMVIEKKTETPEFKSAIKIFGRSKLLELYRAEKRRRTTT